MDICNLNWPISLEQDKDGSFTVSYGADVRQGLNWQQASEWLGNSIMHSLACESIIEDTYGV